MVKLVLFDCDGTLVDSQHMIIAAARQSFAQCGLAVPEDHAVRQIVGLSLPQALAILAGDDALDEGALAHLVASYRQAYFDLRSSEKNEADPLYPGIRETLDALLAEDYLMGVATGNSMRGLRRVIDHHGLDRYFISLQTADGHPSKPDPSMVNEALAETGARASDTVVIGDTSYDMMMARSAGARALGVAWGYHDRDMLERAGAEAIVEDGALLSHVVSSLYLQDEVTP